MMATTHEPTVRDVMQGPVKTVPPGMDLTELEAFLIRERITGAPVVEHGALVGVVSRSDLVRALAVSNTLEGWASDYFQDVSGFATGTQPDPRMYQAQRLQGQVRDIMVHDLITVAPDASLSQLAERMRERHVHRLLVVEDGKLVGIVTAMDLVGLFADGRAHVAAP